MTSVIKELVSKKKRRFVADGYNLDLAYIKPNIVAMGFPANNVEALYRNNIEDVFKFFEEKHSGHYKIYNLCKERQRTYDHKRFPKLAHFPFEDHNAPPFPLIKPFCEDVAQFLSQDELNVAVIHCKAGKGRTGVMIVSYLLHEGIYERVQPALQFYGEARTMDTKGVTIPSQRRYVYYYGDYVSRGLPPYEAESLLLSKIRLVKLPHSQSGSIHLSYSISIGYIKAYSSPYETTRRDLEFKDLVPDRPMPVCGDIKIEIFTKNLKKERLCQFWLNLFFVRLRTKTGEEDSCEVGGVGGEYIVTLTKPELDKINKDKRHRDVPKDFKIEVHFSECSNRVGGHSTDHQSGDGHPDDSDPETDTDLDSDTELPPTSEPPTL